MTMLRLKSHSRGLGLSPRRRVARSIAPSIVQDGLLAEWRLDEGSGQVITDYTGNGHNGVLGFSAGVDGFDPIWTAQGLSFNGGQVCFIADAAGISGGVARTMIMVAKTGPSKQLGCEWGGGGAAGSCWAIGKSASDTLKLFIRGTQFASSLPLPAAEWCFVAGTQSGADLDTVTLYLDGASEASGVSGAIDTINGIILASENAIQQEMEAAYLLVYDRALSAAEVEQNRQALKAILSARGISLP
jgi:hypothetical protein